MLRELKIPLLGENEKYAKLVKCYVEDGQYVKKGQILCFLETTKVVFDFEAEFSGYVKILVSEGEKIELRTVIGYIANRLEELKKIDFKKLDMKKNTKILKGETVATKKALKFAKKHGINLVQIRESGIIREKDVLKYYNKNSNISKRVKKETEDIIPELDDGKVDETFLTFIGQDENFKWLSTDLKIYLYKKFGANIESDVKIGRGAVIIGKKIVMKANSEIGEKCYIKCDSFYLGKMSIIGNKANIVTRRLYIGDVFFSGNNIIIGGGGAYEENSGLKVGNCCLISSGCTINTGCPVFIEDYVGLSPNVSIFTHSHWQNILEGYKANFGSVTLKKGSYITGNVMIVPGVKVGKGATVLANSLVLENVDDYSIVCGVPAKEVYKINPNLTLEKKDMIFKRILEELKQAIKNKGFNYKKLFYSISLSNESISDMEIYLGLEVSENFKRKAKITKQFTIFDLGKYEIVGKESNFSDEVRNFLRKRGVKFSPIHWRYTKDRGFFNQ